MLKDRRETVQETEIQEVAVTVVAEAVTTDVMTEETTENPAITIGTKLLRSLKNKPAR